MTVPLLARAAVTAVRVERDLRRKPLPELCAELGIELGTVHHAAPAVAIAPVGAAHWRAARRVLRVWPAADTCLRRSLVAGSLLRDRHPVLRVGVGRDGKPLAAHAWLEIDGAAVGELPGPFVPLHHAAP